MLLTLLIFIVILSVLVLIHEAGHFFTAKKFGVKVEEFGFGFPPRVFGFKKGETVYSLNALPFGGFVKLFGEDEAGMGKVGSSKVSSNKSEEHRAYYSRSAGQRALIVLAGVIMNTLLAFLLFYIYLGFSNFQSSLPLLTQHTFTNVNQTAYNTSGTDVVVSVASPESPATKAGMNTPARVVSVDGQPVENREEFIEYVNANKGKEISLTWTEIQTGRTLNESLVPRENPPENEGPLGVAFIPMVQLNYDTPAQKALSGITYTYDIMAYTLSVMGSLIRTSIETGDASPVGQSVSGPVGIYSVVGEILKLPDLKQQILGVINLAALLSATLAFFNVLPIPALDGGRLFFILIELVSGRKVNQRYEALAHAIGLVVLLGLIVLITVMDIRKFF